jgi:hypothetical protein
MGQIISLPYRIGRITFTYWSGLYYFLCGEGRHGSYDDAVKKDSASGRFGKIVSHKLITTLFSSNSDSSKKDECALVEQQVRVHLYTLSCNLYLYNQPHYRKDTYVQDLIDNFRNIAIPGTGIPLSTFFYRNPILKYGITLPFLVFGYPLISSVASIHYWMSSYGKESLCKEYFTRLLAPNDWFTYWRYNSLIVALHAHMHQVTHPPNGDYSSITTQERTTAQERIAFEYAMENKWAFLQRGDELQIPVSPFLKEPKALVIKHKNEEGGLGIYFYENAAASTTGNWIVQERLYNSAWVAELLPPSAPLSTFRIITCSRGATQVLRDDDAPQPEATLADIIALSCVFRAGRAHAPTDHEAVFFDVHDGVLGGGTTNAHWYQVGGLGAMLRTPWRTYEQERTPVHPDGAIPVAGQPVPQLPAMMDLVKLAHWQLCPHVPFCGWDVVLSTSSSVPICLLEVNLSCNFFRGSFDKQVRMMDRCLRRRWIIHIFV